LQNYPAQHIKEKLEMAKGLVAAGSRLVSQNPAGWLRRAIEEDYHPPRIGKRHQQHHSRKRDGTPVHAAPREPQMPEKESQRVQSVAAEQRENLPENKEPEKTSRENETTWNKTLEQLQEDLPLGEGERQLKGTTVLQVTDTTARILVPDRFTVAWLERRMYREICKALKGVLGKDLDLQFVAAP
jgi:hypothetical protein